MKKLLLSLILFSFSAFVFAQRKDVLSILMKDGTSVYFLLKEQPRITFENENVKVVSDTDEAVVKRTLVDRFEFIDELPSAIDEVVDNTSRAQFEITGDAIHVSGLVHGCKVQLYSVNGQSVCSAVANESGAVTLSIDALLSGIYLVNYNEITIKFIKR